MAVHTLSALPSELDPTLRTHQNAAPPQGPHGVETCFHDFVTTQYDHPSYVKHVLGRIYVFFTLFGY